jgi:hypothetical protein
MDKLGLRFYVSEIDFPIVGSWTKLEILEVIEDDLKLYCNITLIDDIIYFTEIDGSMSLTCLDEYNWPKGIRFRGEFHG